MNFKHSAWQLIAVEKAPGWCGAKLRQEPAIDKLTGLVNYHGLSETVKSEIKRSNRSGRDFAMLLFELNGMQQINARYGHLTGDRAVCRLAHIFRFSSRLIDTAARFGDDKIAIILPECGAEASHSVEFRICERLSMDREEPLLSVNVGTAAFPGDGKTFDTLFQSAVRTLNQKKERAIQTVTHSVFLPPGTTKQKGVLVPF